MSNRITRVGLPAFDSHAVASAPLLARVDHASPSVFNPENMLREARRQKRLPHGDIPRVCLLDPDGDIVAYVRRRYGATRSRHWACYHTSLWEWQSEGIGYGVVGHAVGGSFAVLVAEQLFVSGCSLLINVASAGQITDTGPPPYHILIAKALRDEGTSYHYLPPSTFVDAPPSVMKMTLRAFEHVGCDVRIGATWTTDAPFRETADTIGARRDQGILAVEMEAAALYAFSAARNRPVICLAHVSNRLGCHEHDFEKGEDNGACSSLDLVTAIGSAWSAEVHGAEAAPLSPALRAASPR